MNQTTRFLFPIFLIFLSCNGNENKSTDNDNINPIKYVRNQFIELYASEPNIDSLDLVISMEKEIEEKEDSIKFSSIESPEKQLQEINKSYNESMKRIQSDILRKQKLIDPFNEKMKSTILGDSILYEYFTGVFPYDTSQWDKFKFSSKSPIAKEIFKNLNIDSIEIIEFKKR